MTMTNVQDRSKESPTDRSNDDDGKALLRYARGQLLECIIETRARADRLAALGTPEAKRKAKTDRWWATKSETLILYFDDMLAAGSLPDWEQWSRDRRNEKPRRRVAS